MNSALRVRVNLSDYFRLPMAAQEELRSLKCCDNYRCEYIMVSAERLQTLDIEVFKAIHSWCMDAAYHCGRHDAIEQQFSIAENCPN